MERGRPAGGLVPTGTEVVAVAAGTGESPRASGSSAVVHPIRDLLHGLYEMRPMTVWILVGFSMGLGLVGAQVTTPWLLALFSVFWGVTVLAILLLVARSLVERGSHHGPRRMAH